jgi:hypothetical protein
VNAVVAKIDKIFATITLTTKHIPGHENPADALSRGALSLSVDDWAKAVQLGEELQQRDHGEPTV